MNLIPVSKTTGIVTLQQLDNNPSSIDSSCKQKDAQRFYPRQHTLTQNVDLYWDAAHSIKPCLSLSNTPLLTPRFHLSGNQRLLLSAWGPDIGSNSSQPPSSQAPVSMTRAHWIIRYSETTINQQQDCVACQWIGMFAVGQ